MANHLAYTPLVHEVEDRVHLTSVAPLLQRLHHCEKLYNKIRGGFVK
jgi:hypothetical protein